MGQAMLPSRLAASAAVYAGEAPEVAAPSVCPISSAAASSTQAAESHDTSRLIRIASPSLFVMDTIIPQPSRENNAAVLGIVDRTFRGVLC